MSALTGPTRRDLKATVTTRSRTPGRARYKPQSHRAGNVDVSASSAVTTLVCFSLLHTGLRVQLNTRHSLRPLIDSRDTMPVESRAIAPRECMRLPCVGGES